MNLPAFCIRRPAFTIVISLVILIIGFIGFMNVPIRWIPNISLSQVSISTMYPGANARQVEHDVTKVIEDSLSGISGIETLTSTSRPGESEVSITFKLGRNMDAAVEDVRSSVERVRENLPREVQNPTVLKATSDNMPILYVSFYNPHYNERQLSDYIDKYIVPSFETIDGVGMVAVYGNRVSAMRVSLDPIKMAGANVTVDEVTRLLQEQNASIPSGQIRGLDRFYSVITDTSLKSPEEFNDLIIRDNQNQVVRLRDIGDVKLEADNVDSAFRINGKPAVALGVIPQSTANPLDVEKNIQAVLANLKHTLPAGMVYSIDYNQADYIRASMHSVYESLLEAVIFVWLVILAFLCSFRATLVPIITIPVCLIGSFAVLYFFGFSINTITLMALVLAIGLVVDDAIVMLENISRHIEQGMKPFAAAIKGSSEMIFPVIAMTLTLTAVYAPIAFTPGLLGTLFREFTFTLAGTVIISGIVALTLSPMMCARFLKSTHESHGYQVWLTKKMTKLQYRYASLLDWLLKRRHWVVLALVVVGLAGLMIYKWLPSELAPAEDMNEVDVYVAAPRSASFHYTDSYVKQLEALYQTIPDIHSSLSIVGTWSPARSYQMLKLKPRNERKQSLDEIIKSLALKTSAISGVKVNVVLPPPALAEFAGGGDGDSIGFVLMTTSDYRKLQMATQRMMDEIRKNPDFVHVENRLKWNSEQFQVNIDRDRAADLKVPIINITNTISTLLAGRNIGKVDDAKVMVRMNDASLADPNILQQLYVRNEQGEMVPLSTLLAIHEATAPEVFNHFDRLRADTIYVSLAPNLKLADAINSLETIAKLNLSDDIKYSFTGEAKNFLESNGKTFFTFLLALVFIYLVLVAQFESFIDPLVILLTVPFAMVGAMLTLKLFGGTLNVYSNIGLVTLIGLIAKHGILITEFANRRRLEGKSVEEAVIEAALLRLRPIMMTTAAMVLGALPLVLSFGPGAESRQQIGLVIAGGLTFGTFFSLIVVPITYTYLAPMRKLTLHLLTQE